MTLTEQAANSYSRLVVCFRWLDPNLRYVPAIFLAVVYSVYSTFIYILHFSELTKTRKRSRRLYKKNGSVKLGIFISKKEI